MCRVPCALYLVPCSLFLVSSIPFHTFKNYNNPTMRRNIAAIPVTILMISIVLMSFSFANKKTPKVLVFCKTGAYYHKSIPAGIAAIQKLAAQNGFKCDTTTDSLKFNTRNLRQYDAVIFLNTTGNVLSDVGQKAFEDYIRSGKGYVGIHSASDTEYDWPWYNQLVGAYFKNHPNQQKATFNIVDHSFPGMQKMPQQWELFEELYNFKDTHWDKMHVLITMDEKTIKGGANGDFHPMSWYHDFEGGRSFYTAIGHLDSTFDDSLYLSHLLGGIQYAIGGKK